MKFLVLWHLDMGKPGPRVDEAAAQLYRYSPA